MTRSSPGTALRLATAQTEAVAGDVAANIAIAVDSIGSAAGAGAALIAFPELSLTGYELGYLAEQRDGWFTDDDARLDPVRRACGAGITAILGAAVRDSDGAPLLAAIAIGPDGTTTVIAKQNLHGKEKELFHAGVPRAPLAIAGWNVSLAICFDAAVPRHAEDAAGRGADLYLVSAFYDQKEVRRVDLHLGARAMDHRMFAALANYAGTTGGQTSCGGSGVWAPSGDVVQRVDGAAPALLVVDLDPAALERYRRVA